MPTLEEATFEQILDEIAKRFPDFAFSGTRECPGRPDANHTTSFVHGSKLKAIAMCRLLQRELEDDFLKLDNDEADALDR